MDGNNAVNVDVTAPGAIIALALMFLKVILLSNRLVTQCSLFLILMTNTSGRFDEFHV